MYKGITLTKKLRLWILNYANSTARLLIDLVDLLIFSPCRFVKKVNVDLQSLFLLLNITLFGRRQLYIFYTSLASLIYYI